MLLAIGKECYNRNSYWTLLAELGEIQQSLAGGTQIQRLTLLR